MKNKIIKNNYPLVNVILLIIICYLLRQCLIPVNYYKQYIVNRIENRVGKEGQEELQIEIINRYGIQNWKDVSDKYLKTKEYIREMVDIFYDLPQFDQRGGGDCDDFQLQQWRLLYQLGYEPYYQVYYGKTSQHQMCLAELKNSQNETTIIVIDVYYQYTRIYESVYQYLDYITQYKTEQTGEIVRYIVITCEEMVKLLQINR